MGRPASACSSAAPSLLNPRPPVRSASIRAAGSSSAALGLIRACHARPHHGHRRRRYWEWGLAMGRRGAVWGCRLGREESAAGKWEEARWAPEEGRRSAGRGRGECPGKRRRDASVRGREVVGMRIRERGGRGDFIFFSGFKSAECKFWISTQIKENMRTERKSTRS